MAIYLTEYLALNEVGRLCKMAGQIEGATEMEARTTAEALGQTFLGKLVEEIEAPEMGNFCDEVQTQRDKDWLEGQ